MKMNQMSDFLKQEEERFAMIQDVCNFIDQRIDEALEILNDYREEVLKAYPLIKGGYHFNVIGDYPKDAESSLKWVSNYYDVESVNRRLIIYKDHTCPFSYIGIQDGAILFWSNRFNYDDTIIRIPVSLIEGDFKSNHKLISELRGQLQNDIDAFMRPHLASVLETVKERRTKGLELRSWEKELMGENV